ncbi:hypothetical protein ACE38W_14850 [Chitinophaga sp. Hz27]|uniref:hypothetical protein n=1 Tax=Chitinophaga sp. Hz27 TaxID=3347169 RepID=UPI0035D82452
MRNLILFAATLVAGTGIFCACKFQSIGYFYTGIGVGIIIALPLLKTRKPKITVSVDTSGVRSSLDKVQRDLNSARYAGIFFENMDKDILREIEEEGRLEAKIYRVQNHLS